MNAIVTGAAGFLGYSLTSELLNRGHTVYAIVRPNSNHNNRFRERMENLHVVELDCSEYDKIPQFINEKCDVFYHLAWFGGRYDLDVQIKNVSVTDMAVKSAAKIGCKRFFGTGSQAEYGPCSNPISEEQYPKPIDAYGVAKVNALFLSKQRTRQFDLEWVWGRVFSLYGQYEPKQRLFPELLRRFLANEEVKLSSCEQYWDYLDVRDAAKAVISIGECGKSGEIYNIASGSCRPLRKYVEEMKVLADSHSDVVYGKKVDPFYSLNVGCDKIARDTGWNAKICFEAGVKDCIKEISFGIQSPA